MSEETGATLRNEAQGLNGKQSRAVDLLAGGASDREVAEAVGCDPSTVWRWRTGDATFRAALNARRQELWQGSLDRIRSLLPRALDVVEHALIEDGDTRAAIALLRLAGLGDVDLGCVGPVRAEVIVEAEEQERYRRERHEAEAELRVAEEANQLDLRRAIAGLPRTV